MEEQSDERISSVVEVETANKEEKEPSEAQEKIFSLSRQEFVTHLKSAKDIMDLNDHFQLNLKPNFRSFKFIDGTARQYQQKNRSFVRRMANQESEIVCTPPISDIKYHKWLCQAYLNYKLQQVMHGKQEVENELLSSEYQRMNTLMSMSQQYHKSRLRNRGKNYFEYMNSKSAELADPELIGDLLIRPPINISNSIKYAEKNTNLQPILGISIYDPRYQKNKVGPKFRSNDKYWTPKQDEDTPLEGYKVEYHSQAKHRYHPIMWRDYLNLSFDMDIVDLIERLIALFGKMDSFDIDPDNRKVLLDESEQYVLHKNVDRAIRWLVDKVSESKLEPIIVTLKDPGDSKKEIEESLNDSRSLVNLDNVKESDKNLNTNSILTPHFLKHFDFENALDRHYLKNKVRFMSIQLGFLARPMSNIMKEGKHVVPFRCMVGGTTWRSVRNKRKKDYKVVGGEDQAETFRIDYDDVKPCPFQIFYVRDIDMQSGMPLSSFKLMKFNIIHSHPLCLDYERIPYEMN